MGVFHDVALSHLEAREGRDYARITGKNPLAYRGVGLPGGTHVGRVDQFSLGFDNARSPQVNEGPTDEPG